MKIIDKIQDYCIVQDGDDLYVCKYKPGVVDDVLDEEFLKKLVKYRVKQYVSFDDFIDYMSVDSKDLFDSIGQLIERDIMDAMIIRVAKSVNKGIGNTLTLDNISKFK